ncbi:hypothetical protein [Bacillus sp. NPDC093026]
MSRGGAASAIYNFNGYGVVIEVSFDTETIIANNVIRLKERV